jgi:hypothetical protein
MITRRRAFGAVLVFLCAGALAAAASTASAARVVRSGRWRDIG